MSIPIWAILTGLLTQILQPRLGFWNIMLELEPLGHCYSINNSELRGRTAGRKWASHGSWVSTNACEQLEEFPQRWKCTQELLGDLRKRWIWPWNRNRRHSPGQGFKMVKVKRRKSCQDAASDKVCLGKTESAFLTKSQVMTLLLLYRPHFEEQVCWEHWFSTRDDTEQKQAVQH